MAPGQQIAEDVASPAQHLLPVHSETGDVLARGATPAWVRVRGARRPDRLVWLDPCSRGTDDC
jgi:hypothetical protein